MQICIICSGHRCNLQLHQWKKAGDIISLKRGVYAFADTKPSAMGIAEALYFPCYFSLDYVLNCYGIMPEVVFAYTLVTPKTTRLFKTPFGVFSFRTIKREAFTGFNSNTLMADKEKALVDYFYLNSVHLQPENSFWEASRLEAQISGVDFKEVYRYAQLFKSDRLIYLLKHFEDYAKSYPFNS